MVGILLVVGLAAYLGERAALAANAGAMQKLTVHGISDIELGAALEGIDAGQLALIIDACNSGQALESDENRQGPFNSKGLAQLAYDKGIYFLTAAQRYQAALENSRLGHGYLTYALIEEGLKQRKADFDPLDGEITLREWLDYAVNRVPELQAEATSEARFLVQVNTANPTRSMRSDLQIPRAFYRRDGSLQDIVAKQ